MPDIRKSLDELRSEWSSCVDCGLGVQRQANKGQFVFGQGTAQGILFVGEGPGAEEEQTGVPFIGETGSLLRTIIKRLGITNAYITNAVACRSCEPALNAEGLPIFRRKNGVQLPLFRDVSPTPVQWKACKKRLEEEIYLVDPVVIVSLGNAAAEALIGSSISITRERGIEQTVEIPGASFVPVLTDTKKVWYRKLHGEWVAPVEQRQVKYTLIPTLHPAFVARRIADRGPDSPFSQLVEDIRKAAKIYEFYMKEVYKVTPTGASDTSYELVSEEYNNLEEHCER